MEFPDQTTDLDKPPTPPTRPTPPTPHHKHRFRRSCFVDGRDLPPAVFAKAAPDDTYPGPDAVVALSPAALASHKCNACTSSRHLERWKKAVARMRARLAVSRAARMGKWSSPPLLRFGGAVAPSQMMCDGAAVLPFMHPPEPLAHNCYFVLGEQAWNPRRPLGGGRLGLLGGCPATPDEPSSQIAAREFLEETIGCVAMTRDDLDLAGSSAGTAPSLCSHQKQQRIASRLESGQFYARLRLQYGDEMSQRYYDVFMVRIPWDPTLVARFAALRAALTNKEGPLWDKAFNSRPHHAALDTMGRLRREYSEIARLSLWGCNYLRAAVKHHHSALGDHTGRVITCRSNTMTILHAALRALQSDDGDVAPSTSSHPSFR